MILPGNPNRLHRHVRKRTDCDGCSRGQTQSYLRKVTPEVARQIMKDHVINGKLVENHVIPM